jgi:hypothetical protein
LRNRIVEAVAKLPVQSCFIDGDYDGEGAVIFKQACALGCEGEAIVINERGLSTFEL